MSYKGYTAWNMIILAAWLFFSGSFVSVGRTAAAYAPFLIILAIAVVMGVFS